MDNDAAYARARKRVAALRRFYVHLAVYVAVSTLLLVVNLASTQHGWWFYWPVLGWGLAVALHAAAVFGFGGRAGREWEERKIREFAAEERGNPREEP